MEFKDFGSLLFDDNVMKKKLDKEIYESLINSQQNKTNLDIKTAECVAKAMKEWALENGCNSYCHWFQPLNGATAEKHEAFVNKDKNNKFIIDFSAKDLIKGEPDASSFPSGGLRSTFEARGYTYWDITSPAFIREKTLCIPSIFVSFNGISLDGKGPLLKSCDLINDKATELLHLLGYKDVKKVTPMVGLEQEYFLVDRPLYKERLDLILCGRTLFGTAPSKGQELEDHYFGAIPTRVSRFMDDVNHELWKIGIYAKTNHNEVAPMQFEIASIYGDVNTTIDQNQVMMDVLRRVAYNHGYACLLHEKPFNYINGSGKHNNYSLSSDTNVNVFSIGKTEQDELKFIVFTTLFIKAVDNYQALLRLSVANRGNEFRLGGNEAPPAIISIYLGNVVESLFAKYLNKNSGEKEIARTKINGIGDVLLDESDRNRTSPVAFTGSKFEFRMLGSSMNASLTNTVLNTIFAKEIDELLVELKGKKDIKGYLNEFIKSSINEHKRIIFDGNGYSNDWVEEAKNRGLLNIKNTVDALNHFDDIDNLELFEKYNIFTELEIKARKEVYLEQYISIVEVEAKTLSTMVNEKILPSISSQLAKIKEIKEFKCDYVVSETRHLKELLNSLYIANKDLDKYLYLVINEKELCKKSDLVVNNLIHLIENVRDIIDEYEKVADKSIYKIPTYNDMLY